MARIKHLAIKTADPARLAKFYEETFGLQPIHSSPNGGVYMSDGYLTLALLKQRPNDTAPGINHFGFEVENADEISAKIVAQKLPEPTQRPNTTPFAERRGMDPDGNLFDISEHGYADVEYPLDRDAKQTKQKETVR